MCPFRSIHSDRTDSPCSDMGAARLTGPFLAANGVAPQVNPRSEELNSVRGLGILPLGPAQLPDQIMDLPPLVEPGGIAGILQLRRPLVRDGLRLRAVALDERQCNLFGFSDLHQFYPPLIG